MDFGSEILLDPPTDQSQEYKATEVRPIKPGETVERDIPAGERHVYLITLKADEYLKIAAHSHVEYTLEVIDPSNKRLAECGSANDGPTDTLWLAATKAGDYQIRISGSVFGHPVYRYRFTVEKVASLSTAPIVDQQYLKAERLFFDAGDLVLQGTSTARNQAIEILNQDLEVWRTLHDKLGEASTLYLLAYAYAQLHQFERSIDTSEQALVLLRPMKDREANLANTLNNAAGVYSTTGQIAKAIDYHREAASLRRTFANSDLDNSLTSLGALYRTTGEFELALKANFEALQLRAQMGYRQGEARSLSNISAVYFQLGQFQEALNYCLRSLPLRRATGDRRGETVTLINIGSNYRELGEPERALSYYLEALSLARQVNDRPDELIAGALDGTGRCYYDTGESQQALEQHLLALALRQRIGDRGGQATSLTSIGDVYSRLKDQKSAISKFDLALELQRSIGDRRGEAITLQRMAESCEESGDLKTARSYVDEGLKLSRAIEHRLCEANLLYDLALIESKEGDFLKAHTDIQSAISIIESSRARVASRSLRASFLASKQDFYDLHIDLLMQAYRQTGDRDLMLKAFSVSEERRARSLLDLLEEPHKNVRRKAAPELIERELVLRARLEFKVESQIKLLSGKHTQDEADKLTKEVEVINRDYQQVIDEIAASDPHYAALTRSDALTVSTLQQAILDPDVLLLEYSLGKEQSYLWAADRSGVWAFPLPPRTTIENQARRIYELLSARNQFVKFEKPSERETRITKADADYGPAAAELSDMLLGPVATAMKGKRLLIVADGALQYLPFSALPTPASKLSPPDSSGTVNRYRPMMLDHEITLLPSASVLSVIRQDMAQRKSPPKTIAVLADAVFNRSDERVVAAKSNHNLNSRTPRSGRATRGQNTAEQGMTNSLDDAPTGIDLNRLPFTREEAATILRLIPPSQRFAAFDFAANRAAAINSELGHYRIVHFATHGVLNTAHPGLSGLIFSLIDRQGRDQKGFVAAQDVYNLHLPADLIVLSGCRTGLGKEIRGEGLLGLTRGFMYAGAARVAVSLWDVNDKSTAELMGYFYRGMLGPKKLSPAAAMREAQISMWKSSRWQSPYYWAPFVLQGEYR